jgi:hypothetical protein
LCIADELAAGDEKMTEIITFFVTSVNKVLEETMLIRLLDNQPPVRSLSV